MVGDNVHMFNKGYRFVNSIHFHQCASQRYDKLRIDNNSFIQISNYVSLEISNFLLVFWLLYLCLLRFMCIIYVSFLCYV